MASPFAGYGVDLTGQSVPLNGADSFFIKLSHDAAQMFKDYMRDAGIDATGSTSQSIGARPVKITNKGAEIEIESLPHYKFIDEGVDGVEVGHGSPFSFKSIKPFNIEGIESIMTWYGAKGLPSVPDYKSVAYAISVHIKKVGIKPKKITDGVMQRGFMDFLADAVAEVLGESMEITLTNEVRKWQSQS
jgi:hypothetical protein